MAELQFEIPKMYPKQLMFCQSTAESTLFGGARGGGKSFVVRMKAIQLAFKYPGIHILLLRRTFPELEQNHLNEFRGLLNGLAKYNVQSKTFSFGNGSTLRLGHFQTEGDWTMYQGQSYEAIFMDEATNFTEFMYLKLTECLRLSGSVDTALGLKPRMYLTANPGGVGMMWVKKRFVDNAKLPEGKRDPKYAYIPCLVFENEFIMEHDPNYVERLKALPEKERQAMLYGDWDVFQGQFFEEFDEAIHCFNDLSIVKAHWRTYRARDYGLDKTACLWAKLDEEGTIYIYKAFGQSNLTVSNSGNIINSLTLENEQPYLDICPPDMWNRQSQTGKSAVDILIKECNQRPIKANNDRINGWLQVKELLQVSSITGKPRLLIHISCKELIEDLKMIQHDEKNPNDCAKDPHDLTHFPDALRYLCTSYTYPPDPLQATIVDIPNRYARMALEVGEYEVKDEEEDYYFDLEGGYYA